MNPEDAVNLLEGLNSYAECEFCPEGDRFCAWSQKMSDAYRALEAHQVEAHKVIYESPARIACTHGSRIIPNPAGL